MTPSPSPRALVVVAAGGAIGALARYGLGCAFPVAAGTFPMTTFAINVSGAFLLAFLLETLRHRNVPGHWLRLFVGVGALGAFTTFSTTATELAVLVRDGHRVVAFAYAGLSIAAGTAAVLLGLMLAGFRSGPVPDEAES